ncbi:hypothetical protein C7C56_008950 [Massilia glaciei]|uniref:Uncharacterized protein n=1 Tax=Massilia glaciei TaxID=1524097 RepID=A0A2U2HNM1_9BURK|nr:hypothetical protein C7C56_008950 [Massilia glaciei]
MALAASPLPDFAQVVDCTTSFGFRADVNGVAGLTLCDAKVDTFLDTAKNFALSNSGYNNTAAILAQGRFNDVNISLSFAANSPTLSYNFAELGVSGAFTGATRAQSQELFLAFLKQSDLVGRMLKYQSEHSTASTVTGMGGAIPTLGQADFAVGFEGASQIGAAAQAGGAEGGTPSLVGLGLSYGSFSMRDGSDVRSTSLPLSYTVRNGIDPRRQFVVSVPLSRVTVGAAVVNHGGLGLAYRLPMSDRWTLTPGARYAVSASRDRATATKIYSASLVSTYLVPAGALNFAIGNMVGVYRTGAFRNGGYTFDPDITLTMLRNGVLMSLPARAFGPKLVAEVSLIDTRYVGSKPFASNTQELGISLGTNKRASNARSYTRAGAAILRGKNAKGFTVNFGYWF